MMWKLRILFPFHFVVFNQTVCHLTDEDNVEQVFSRTGQLSEVNLDPDALTDMVSTIVNKFRYKPSVKDIMDKYYEMFHVKKWISAIRRRVDLKRNNSTSKGSKVRSHWEVVLEDSFCLLLMDKARTTGISCRWVSV